MKTLERISLSVFALSLALWLISCAGGTAGQQQNPTPSVSSIAPASAMAGGAAFTLTVNGSNFISTSAVRWNGSGRSTTFVSSTELTVAISAADIAIAGSANVNVFNPAPGGGASNGATFSINNPAPAVSGLTPSSADPGGSAFTLTVDGWNFVSSSVVQWNGSNRTTAFVSSARLTAAIPSSDIATLGTAQVTVLNPTPGGGASNASAFSIGKPVPAIASASDSRAPAGWPGFALTLTGSGFVSASVAQWNGLNRPTTVLSSTQLRAAIPPEDLAAAGTAQVAVFNPSPGGGTSNALDFTIYAVASNAVGVIDRASVGEGFASGDSDSWGSAINADGRYVAFASYASNLVPGNGGSYLFVRDTCLGAPPGCTPSVIRVDDKFYGSISQPSISATGRYVAFFNYHSDMGEVFNDIYVRDTCIGAPSGCVPATTWVATTPPHSSSVELAHSLSANGRYVAYSYTYYRPFAVLHGAIADTCLGTPSGCVPSTIALPDEVTYPVLSADGRFAAFQSDRSDLVPNDTNNTGDVFLMDSCLSAPSGCTPSTTRVSVASDGTQGNAHSGWPTISADGRFVAFDSGATNLVVGDTNGKDDSFVRDTCFGAPAGCVPSTTRVSVADDGSQGNDSSGIPSISGNGRFVAFDSGATNLVVGDTNGKDDSFVRDTCFGAPAGCTPSTVRVSVALDGTEGDDWIGVPRISGDGRYVAFESYATNLAPGSGSFVSDVFVARTGKP